MTLDDKEKEGEEARKRRETCLQPGYVCCVPQPRAAKKRKKGGWAYLRSALQRIKSKQASKQSRPSCHSRRAAASSANKGGSLALLLLALAHKHCPYMLIPPIEPAGAWGGRQSVLFF